MCFQCFNRLLFFIKVFLRCQSRERLKSRQQQSTLFPKSLSNVSYYAMRQFEILSLHKTCYTLYKLPFRKKWGHTLLTKDKIKMELLRRESYLVLKNSIALKRFQNYDKWSRINSFFVSIETPSSLFDVRKGCMQDYFLFFFSKFLT